MERQLNSLVRRYIMRDEGTKVHHETERKRATIKNEEKKKDSLLGSMTRRSEHRTDQ